MSQPPVEPRPYLRARERRTQILDTAAAIVGRDGLGSLTVAGVAVEAGVSRQWVYEHFSDLDDLSWALILDRFASLDASIDTAKKRLTGPELATFAARQLFALVPADRRILRALVDGGGGTGPELTSLESDLRERVFRRWTGFVRDAGHNDLDARAIVWAIVNALFGLADQVERESLGIEAAVGILERFVEACTVSPTPGHRLGQRSTRVESVQSQGTGSSHAH